MSNIDTSYAAYMARIRQRTLVGFHRANPTAPEQGPYGSLDAATYLTRRVGEINGLCCTPTVSIPTIVMPDARVYFIGYYFSPELSIYNVGGNLFKTVSNIGDESSDVIIVTYDENGSVQWVARVAGISNEDGNGITADANGNSYVTGNYESAPVSIYNADDSVFGTLENSGNRDAFLVKYDKYGKVEWGTRIAGTRLDNCRSVCVNADNSIFMTGEYTSSPITFYNASGSAVGTLSFSGVRDVFIAKYDTVGSFLWAARIAGPLADNGYRVTSDSSNNAYIVGGYSSSSLLIYNSNDTVFGSLSNSGFTDGFIVKYDTYGNVQWATRIAGGGVDQVNGVDSTENVYITGLYGGSIPITIYNADGGIFGTLTNDGNNDAFIVKYDSFGYAQWATHIGGGGSDIGSGVSVESSGNVYVVGSYSSSPLSIYNSDSGLFGTLSYSGTGTADLFFVKYNSSGIAQWAVHGDGARGNSITVGSNGDTYITGGYSASVCTLYNADGSIFQTLSNAGSLDMYVAKYNSNGDGQWATKLSGTGINIARDICIRRF